MLNMHHTVLGATRQTPPYSHSLWYYLFYWYYYSSQMVGNGDKRYAER